MKEGVNSWPPLLSLPLTHMIKAHRVSRVDPLCCPNMHRTMNMLACCWTRVGPAQQKVDTVIQAVLLVA
eukprot:1137859-Pelagomonas_calceolata.AAC.4